MACRNCRTAFHSGAAVCPFCGEDEQRWNRRRHLLCLLLGVFILGLTVALILIIAAASPL